MFCKRCGKEIKENGCFCPFCGAKQQAPDPEMRAGSEMIRGEDGKYRWVYEVNLLKNPAIFFLIWRIFFFIFIGIFAFTMLMDAINWPQDFFPDRFLTNLSVLGCILMGMTALVALGYLIYAAIMGGKYCVLFEMDEKGVNHKQMPKQAKKAEMLSALTAAAGFASGRLAVIGAGMNAARTEMYSDFAKVRKVKSYPRRHLIKVNGLFSHNQVYTKKEDFSFVKDYIIAHCPNLKEKNGP